MLAIIRHDVKTTANDITPPLQLLLCSEHSYEMVVAALHNINS